MTPELQKQRDDLALKYGNADGAFDYPDANLVKDFKAGFDAARAILAAENERLSEAFESIQRVSGTSTEQWHIADEALKENAP